MAVGRESTNQTTEAKRPGYVTAIQGRDGRIAAPPRGDMYVRDPAAARAQAIRDRVKLHKEVGTPIPPHLQKLLDTLPPEDGNSEVELVDQVTGDHVAEVDLEDPPPQVQNSDNQTEMKLKSTDMVVPVDPDEPIETFEVHDVTPEKVDGPTGTIRDGLLDLVNDEEIIDVEVVEPEVVEPEPVKVEATATGAGVLGPQAAAIERAAAAQAPAPSKPLPPPARPKPAARKTAPRKKP